MATLKDDFLEDLSEVFFNFDEFSENIKITDTQKDTSYTFIGQIDHIEKDLKEPGYGERIMKSVETVLYFKYLDGVLTDNKNFFDTLRSGKLIRVNTTSYSINQAFIEEKLFILRLDEVVGQ